MKKIITLVLVLSLALAAAFTFTSCSLFGDKDKTDWEAVEEKGYFICGITGYAPMNYFDEEGDIVGFDTEFAQAVAEELGVEVKFQVISWGSKYLELNSGSIDAIWNGFTFGNESDGTSRTDYVDFSYAYLNNSQCIVVNKSIAASLTSAEDFKTLKGAAEGGSSGEAIAEELSDNYTASASQASALLDLKGGQCDFVVIDAVMANEYVGKGDYADLTISEAVVPEGEVFAIGFRKGSDLTAKVNEAIKAVQQSGKLAAIAAKYELSNSLIPNIGE